MLDHLFISLPTLETERLILRKILYSDKEAIYNYAKNPNVAEHLLWNAHQSTFDTIVFLNLIYDAYNKNEAAPWGIQLKDSDYMVGTVGFVSWDKEKKEAEIGYALTEELWNKGIVTEAVNKVLEFGFEIMKLDKILSQCNPENVGSFKVLEKTGFNFDGIIEEKLLVKGKYEDMKMFSLDRQNYLNNEKNK